jgi:hypothetical protein
MRGDGRVFLNGKVFWMQFYVNGVSKRENTHETDEMKARKRLRDRLGDVAQIDAAGRPSFRRRPTRCLCGH